MAAYQCPMCGREMERDLILFLDHTHQHVIDKIKDEHPEWVAADGVCKPCAEYYQRQLSGGAEKMNIGPEERRRRAVLGVVTLTLSFVSALFLVFTGAARLWRLVLFLPLFLGILCGLEVKKKTCVVLAELGTRNMDFGPSKIEDRSIVNKVKAEGRGILVQSALWASWVTALLLLFP